MLMGEMCISAPPELLPRSGFHWVLARGANRLSRGHALTWAPGTSKRFNNRRRIRILYLRTQQKSNLLVGLAEVLLDAVRQA